MSHASILAVMSGARHAVVLLMTMAMHFHMSSSDTLSGSASVAGSPLSHAGCPVQHLADCDVWSKACCSSNHDDGNALPYELL